MEASQTWYQIPIEAYLPGAVDALLNKRIPSLIPTRILAGDHTPMQEYCLDGLVSYHQALSKAPTNVVREMLQALCTDIIRCPRLADEAYELLTADRLFWDPASRCWRYLLLIAANPRWRELDAPTPGQLLTELLQQAINAAIHAREYLLLIWTQMGGRIVLPESLLYALDATDPSSLQRPKISLPRNQKPDSGCNQNGEDRPDRSNVSFQMMQGWNQNQPQPIISQRPAGETPGPVKTIALGISGISTSLREPKHSQFPTLVRLKTHESMAVNRSRLYIGSNAEEADFVIQNNSTISRLHACILFHDGQYFIIDNNSLNGVYKGERRLLPNHETRLEIGESFRLADESFILRW